MNDIDLRGRTAIVTGAASGLGLATAQRLLASGAGVWAWDRDQKNLAAAQAMASQPGLRTQVVDVGDRESVERAASDVLGEAAGIIDILVNCAGVDVAPAPVEDLDDADWFRALTINLTGIFYTCRAIVPSMKAHRYGRIVNVSSIAGKEGNAFQSAYSASKAGAIGFTKSIAKELAEFGIVANCMAPSVFDTPMHRATRDRDPRLMEGILQKIPMKRVGAPQEFAAMAAWLASAECSFTTGAVFDLSGGRATY